jgi:glycosyltransferase involved in cell wall biosynthesis
MTISGVKKLDNKKLLFIVIPVFNEELQIRENLTKILYELSVLSKYSFEVVVIDDGSKDQTRSILFDLQKTDSRLKLIGFTRNFGKEAAILAGLEASTSGDAVVVMDSDLQHPPGLLASMISIWEKGVLVVEAVKLDRDEKAFINHFFTKWFYTLFYRFSGLDLANQTDFKLIDRDVLESYLNLSERGRFFRGLVSWLGYSSAQVTFKVPPRTLGGSRWSKFKLWGYGISAITSFSSRPLYVIVALGLITFALSIFIGLKVLFDYAVGDAVPGFTTVILLQLLLSAILMMGLGIIGLYIARLHDEIKCRPHYVVGWKFGFDRNINQKTLKKSSKFKGNPDES